VTATADASIEELVGAYRILGIPHSASAAAIRARYRELAQVHHPDKHPHGTTAQARAHVRMQEINAAFELIQHAPLLDRHIAPDPVPEPEPPSAQPFYTSVLGETLIRFVLGLAVGGYVAMRLHRAHVPGGAIYVWLLPLLMGLGFTNTSSFAATVLRLLYWRI
jgi:hypothetical protein